MWLLVLTLTQPITQEPTHELVQLAQCSVASKYLEYSPYISADFNIQLLSKINEPDPDLLYGQYMYYLGVAEGQYFFTDRNQAELAKDIYQYCN